ncbi:S-type pyocin domain-containing protein [Pseudomonas aeruginosa]|nr:S-type pyocin domain-containing protein [Pseudomonas aeruginosa]MBP8322985.1 S-type pyocin domain-containing protein [Pseudomonas aeruginosa]MBP8358667.1 S-type pyocin domain-containing protein [Pseudomonas aeruginosa]MBP8364410.1 S-type pyocin domain-containing protein [Pseudomonas aeruginosa]HCE8453930.1 S-type pyocin domain-containing protein [Pseudomonas aeruginosa]
MQTANNALIAKAPNALEKQKATYNADLLVDEIASLQARLDKLNAETARRKEIARQAAIRAANTYAMPANGSVVATAAGRGLIQVAQGAASLAQAISDAIAVLGRVLASAPSVMAVGFASLTYSSRTAEQWQDQTPDSVRYALGMDAAKLGLPPSVNLNAVAKASGTVDLPMRLTNEARGNTTTLSVVSTDGVSVPKAVPVRMAAYNATTGLYEVTVPSTTAEAPPLILTWTPASPPGNQNPSSTTPVVPKPVPVYEGVTLTPLKTEPESYPGVLLDLNDLIVIFPADSGVKPVYVMLSSPLDSGIFTRKQLLKKYQSHADDFGFAGRNANNTTLAEFRDKILEHLGSPSTIEKGVYHRYQGSKVFYNPDNNIVVVLKEDGMFLSGWYLEPGSKQEKNYFENEVL